MITSEMFLILDFQIMKRIFFPERISQSEIFFMKKGYNKIKSIEKRISEQIICFLKLQFDRFNVNIFYLIFINQSVKWVFPISQKKKKLKHQKQIVALLMNIFLQEIKISNSIFIEEKLRNRVCSFKFMAILESIFYIITKTNRIKCDVKIVNLICMTHEKENIVPIQLILLAKKLHVCFDTFLINKKDSYFFHYLSEKTGGIYCRPSKNFSQLIFTESLLSILLSIFLPSFYSRELFVLPFNTRLVNQNRSDSFGFDHKKFCCPVCFTFYTSLFTDCFVCGLSFSTRYD